MMKLAKLFTVITVASALFLTGNVIADTAVIIHPSNGDTLDAQAIKKIFLGKAKSFPSGASVLPLNHKEGSATRTAFDDGVLSKSPSQVKAYWSKLVFTGKGTPPKEVSSDAEVIGLVSANPSTIGYIDASAVNDSVKVVYTF